MLTETHAAMGWPTVPLCRLYLFDTCTVDTYTRASLGLIQPSLSPPLLRMDSFHQSAVDVLLVAPSVDVAVVVPDPVLLGEPFAFKLCG